jgi:hypothetical protein
VFRKLLDGFLDGIYYHTLGLPGAAGEKATVVAPTGPNRLLLCRLRFKQ